jgi:LPPG:FO 2-phospho-L-lactate transferase
MAAQGLEVSIAGIATCYRDFIDLLVVDSRDAATALELSRTGLRVHCAPIVMQENRDKVGLAKCTIEACRKRTAAEAATERP